ncbi:MAG: hypothetical protein P8Y79_09445, partial [Ignavibacteriaceae bacterium]
MAKSHHTYITVLFLSIFSNTIFSQNSNTSDQISVLEFGAIANDNNNDREQINNALKFCKEHKVSKLFFPPGKYILSHPEAIQLMEDVIDLKMGRNPEKVIFVPYYPYVKGLDLTGQNNLKLLGQGVELICRGWMETISIEESDNISIEGITIDYERQPHSEGTIVDITDNYFDVVFGDDYPVKSNMVMPRIMFWDTTKNRLHKDPIYFPKKNKLIATQTLRIWGKLPPSYLNSIALINHSFHFRPAIFIHQSSDIVLKNVTIHSQPGMGIVGHRSNNITMDGLRVVPRAGK